MFGLLRVLRPENMPDSEPATQDQVRDEVLKLTQLDVAGSLKEFYTSPDLWLGVLVAALLLAAAMWVRRYRDENS